MDDFWSYHDGLMENIEQSEVTDDNDFKLQEFYLYFIKRLRYPKIVAKMYCKNTCQLIPLSKTIDYFLVFFPGNAQHHVNHTSFRIFDLTDSYEDLKSFC